MEPGPSPIRTSTRQPLPQLPSYSSPTLMGLAEMRSLRRPRWRETKPSLPERWLVAPLAARSRWVDKPTPFWLLSVTLPLRIRGFPRANTPAARAEKMKLGWAHSKRHALPTWAMPSTVEAARALATEVQH